jgi:hypothetical protein
VERPSAALPLGPEAHQRGCGLGNASARTTTRLCIDTRLYMNTRLYISTRLYSRHCQLHPVPPRACPRAWPVPVPVPWKSSQSRLLRVASCRTCPHPVSLLIRCPSALLQAAGPSVAKTPKPTHHEHARPPHFHQQLRALSLIIGHRSAPSHPGLCRVLMLILAAVLRRAGSSSDPKSSPAYPRRRSVVPGDEY